MDKPNLYVGQTFEVIETQDINNKSEIYPVYKSGCTPKFRTTSAFILWIKQGAK